MQKPKSVKNPRKQRKRFFNATAHRRHKSMSAPLSKELAASRGVRSLPVRKGDTVRIMRGDNKGFEGKVSRVALNEYRIYMEGLTREKVDGTNIFLPIHPSKVQIRNLKMDDRWRRDILSRKKPLEKLEEEKPKAVTAKIAEEPAEKPEEKVEVVEEVKPVKKPVKAPPVKAVKARPPKEAMLEAAKEEALAEEVEEALKEAPAAKKARAKKPAAAKKPATKKEEAPEEKVIEEQFAPAAQEKAPATKEAKPKAKTEETAEPEEAPEKKPAAKKTAAKPRAKRKASEETEGGQ